MNFIYRIYEVNYNCQMERSDIILNQEVMITDSRENFKDNLRALYPEIKFANNRKLKNGEIYCIIISDNCYNIEEYLDIKEYECSHCHKIFKSNEKKLNKYYYTGMFKNDNIDKEILNEHINEIKNMRFCSKLCELEHMLTITSMLEEETNIKFNGDFTPDIFITKDTYSNNNNNNNNVIGYIYKISKKSTQEFYIGKTIHVPIFRWGQHLLTERFDIKNIGDYVFEIVEVISKSKDKDLLNKREAYWINKSKDENPELSLNIIIPKEKGEN